MGYFMQKKRKWVSLLATVSMILTLMLPVSVQAAETGSVDRPEVYQKQNQRGTCTLSSAAMMLRRAAIYDGNENWSDIKESTVRKTAWAGGLKWNFTYGGMSVKHGSLPGGSANKNRLKTLLSQHPEGIVLYDKTVPHAVLLTDYTDGRFYCADPANCVRKGRVPLCSAYGVKMERARAVWYIDRDSFIADNLKYQVIDSGSGKDTVQVTGMVNTQADSLDVPTTVTYRGKTYRVTRIAENAFADCEYLENILLGDYVSLVGENAFGDLDLNEAGMNIAAMDILGI